MPPESDHDARLAPRCCLVLCSSGSLKGVLAVGGFVGVVGGAGTDFPTDVVVAAAAATAAGAVVVCVGVAALGRSGDIRWEAGLLMGWKELIPQGYRVIGARRSRP